MIQKFAAFLFNLLGWETAGDVPPNIKKYIIVAAPHTTNWDFLYGMLFFLMKDVPFKFFIKKDWYFFPLNLLFNALGGIPVDRKKNENLTDQIAKIFQQKEELVMLVTPEGTRSYNPNWKKGFYYLAKKANVPIILGYIDYAKKIGGIGPVFELSDNIEEDIVKIKAFYKNKKGKYPEKGVR